MPSLSGAARFARFAQNVGALHSRRARKPLRWLVWEPWRTSSRRHVRGLQYWNTVYGGCAEDVSQDTEGLQTMRPLGRNMAFMMKSFQLGWEQFGLPTKEAPIFTNFHR